MTMDPNYRAAHGGITSQISIGLKSDSVPEKTPIVRWKYSWLSASGDCTKIFGEPSCQRRQPVYSYRPATGIMDSRSFLVHNSKIHLSPRRSSLSCHSHPFGSIPALPTLKEVAAILRKPVKSIHALCRAGKLGFVWLNEKERAFKPNKWRLLLLSEQWTSPSGSLCYLRKTQKRLTGKECQFTRTCSGYWRTAWKSALKR